MLRSRKVSRFHGLAVLGHTIHGFGAQVLELFDEFWKVSIVKTQKVMEDKDLSVAMNPRTNSNCRYFNFVGNNFC